MRALHVFPIFHDQPMGGSDYYQLMLTRTLAGLGVTVEVFATCARHVRATSALALDWRADYPPGSCRVQGIPVRRFPATFSMPRRWGSALSRIVVRRWRLEEERFGGQPKGAEAVVDSYHRRALTRPLVYDCLALLGRGPHSLRLLSAVLRTMSRYDIILAGFTPFATMWYLATIARHFGKPIILLPLFHPEDLYHHFRLFYRCFERADAILTQTAYSTELFARLCPAAHPVEVGVGIDAGELSSQRISGARFRTEHGLTDKRLVLFVGRKEHHKRYDLAVQAVDMLDDPDVTLVMIGHDVDQLPINSPKVRFLGPVARRELLDAYDACDVFILPSEHESFGIVFLEAWMRRKPVIGNGHCAPVASIIEDGRDGLLCFSAEDLAAKIRRLLCDPALRRTLGEAGFRKASGRYTWDAIGAQVLALYERVTSSR